jgi:hypothetical protein
MCLCLYNWTLTSRPNHSSMFGAAKHTYKQVALFKYTYVHPWFQLTDTYVYWTVHHCGSWIIKDQLDVTCYFYFLCTQHVSDINIPIIRSLRLCCWITTLVVLSLFRCVLEIWCGWVWVVPVLQASAYNTDTTQIQPHQISNTQRNKNKTTNVVIKQHRSKLLMMGILMSETCWVHKK